MRARAAGIAVVALLLAGCSAGDSAGAREVQLPDGRTVVCVFQASQRGGVSCDWANAKSRAS